MPTTRRASGKAMNANTGSGRQRETGDPPAEVQDEGAGGEYRTTGEDAEDSAADGNKGSGDKTAGDAETAWGVRRGLEDADVNAGDIRVNQRGGQKRGRRGRQRQHLGGHCHGRR